MSLYFRRENGDVFSTQEEQPTEVKMEEFHAPKHHPVPVSRCRAKWIYGFMLLMHFMLALDTTSVAVALPVCNKMMTTDKDAPG